MELEWDEIKNHKNKLKHGFDFYDAPEIFTDYYLENLIHAATTGKIAG